ncbi:hypothetical protein ACF0H5_012365 [Mactra antiquata]
MSCASALKILICVIAVPQVTGFICYRCSYSPQTEGSRRECIEKPEALGINSRLECNSTSFCVLQEQYNIHLKTVTSYFRSCSGNSWGNECSKDYTHVTCRGSCQGNYCNENDVGERYASYLEKHKNDIEGSGHINTSCTVLISLLCSLCLSIHQLVL